MVVKLKGLVIILVFVKSINIEKRPNVRGLLRQLEEFDYHTLQHCIRVRNYAVKFGKILKLSFEEQMILEKSALLHDIGKILIPDYILNKPGKLNNEEWQVVRKHPEYGEAILSQLQDEISKKIVCTVGSHHEHYDGKGYPNGLKGEDIPYLSRVISIIDVFDALTDKRSYREAYTFNEAIEIIKELKGNQLDNRLTEIFIREIAKQ